MRPLGKTPPYSKGAAAKRRRSRSDNHHCAAGFQPALEFLFYICSATRGLLYPPLAKGTPRFFAAGGLDFTTEDPLWSPFSSLLKGDKGARPKVWPSSFPRKRE